MAAPMRLTMSALTLLRPSASRARRSLLSTLASSPLLAGSRAKLPPVDNVVRSFNFSTVCHSSSVGSEDRWIAYGCFTQAPDRIDALEFTAMELEPIVDLIITAGTNSAFEIFLKRANGKPGGISKGVVETEDFMKVLLEKKNGLAGRIFSKAGLDNTSILQAIDDFISEKHSKMVRDRTALQAGQHLYSLLDNSIKLKKDMEDEIVSVEHFLLAFCLDGRFGQQLFTNMGINEKDLRDAIHAVRESQKRELNEHWGVEKELMNRIRTLKEEIDRINVEIGDRTLISLQRQLEEAEKHLAEIESKWTGTHFEDALHQDVVGQNMAVISVADAIRRSRAGLSDPNRPIASFMFMGSTGVGKKTLVKTLADYLLNIKESFNEVRVDMGENAVSRLVVALQYGRKYEVLVQLTEFVRHRPYCVLLFEEIEKAHPDALSILLQVLENGRITDCQGRTVCFKNTVIIMTSKIGSHLIQDTLSSNTHDTQEVIYDIMKKQVVDLAGKTFCPEFMNCIDECVVFKPLDATEIRSLAERKMSSVKGSFKQVKIELQYTEEVIDLVARLYYDPNYAVTVDRDYMLPFDIEMSVLWAKSLYHVFNHEIKVDINSNLGLGDVRGTLLPTHYQVDLGTDETGIQDCRDSDDSDHKPMESSYRAFRRSTD